MGSGYLISVEHKRWGKVHAVFTYKAGYTACGIPLRKYVYELHSKKEVTCKNCLRIMERRNK
jgi:hypothetical protein